MQQDLQPLVAIPTTDNDNKSSCLYTGKCIYSRLTELEKTVQLLQNQLKELQKETATNTNQWAFCSANLNKLGIPTDKQFQEEYQNWSCGNHYDW